MRVLSVLCGQRVLAILQLDSTSLYLARHLPHAPIRFELVRTRLPLTVRDLSVSHRHKLIF